jgi:cell division ATPase FtsA
MSNKSIAKVYQEMYNPPIREGAPPGQGGYDREYKEAAFSQMVELVNKLKKLKDNYSGKFIDPNDSMFDTIDQIVALAGSEGEEDNFNTGHEDIDIKDDTEAAEYEMQHTDY